MIKRTLIWSLKGGQGKTHIAVAIAKHENAYICANEPHSAVPRLLGKDRALAVKLGGALPKVPATVPLLYDFGGFAESRVVEAAKDSQYVVIPVAIKSRNSQLELEGAVHSIRAMKKHNPNIIVVNNMSKTGHMEIIQSAFKQAKIDVPLLDIKNSNVFEKAIAQDKSIQELVGENALFKYNYSVPLLQLRTLIKFISR